MSIRFGRSIEELPEALEFGDWGVLPTTTALTLFADAHAYYDSEATQEVEKKRLEMIQAARRYYDGYHVKPLKVRPGEPDDNVLVNLCRALIDDSVSWLFGNPETGVLTMEASDAPVSSEDGERTGFSNNAGTFLEKIYEDSGGFQFFKRLGLRSAISGHAFVKLIFDDKIQGPKAVVLDPTMVFVRRDPSDIDRPVAYAIEWQREEVTPGTMRRETYVYRQLVVETDREAGAWVIGDFKAKLRKKREWQLINGPWAWPWRWSPIHDCANLEPGWGYYGLSDLEDAAGLNDALNMLISNSMRIIKIHAHPKTIGTGFGAGDVQDTAVDAFWTIENPEAKVQNLEMQSDLSSSLAIIDFIKTAFWTIGRGLDPSTYKDKIGQITNFALRVLAIRAIHKMGDKRLSYGKMLRLLNRHALEMLGLPEQETIIQWPEALPEDPADTLDRLEREVAMQITSRQTAAEELGRSWEIERARIKGEQQERLDLGQQLLAEFDRGGGPFGANSANNRSGRADQRADQRGNDDEQRK